MADIYKFKGWSLEEIVKWHRARRFPVNKKRGIKEREDLNDK